MQNKVQEFQDTGYVSKTSGDYKRLKPYSSSWAQLGWYAWEPVDTEISNDFILSTDLTWSSASKTPDPSGCGFVFRLQPNSDHYMVFLATDGYVEAAHNINNDWALMGRDHFGKAGVAGKVNVVLIVE